MRSQALTTLEVHLENRHYGLLHFVLLHLNRLHAAAALKYRTQTQSAEYDAPAETAEYVS